MKINSEHYLPHKKRRDFIMIIILTTMTMNQLMKKLKIVVLKRVTKMKRLLSKRKKNIKKKNITKIKPPLLKKQQKTKTKRHHRLYKQLIVFKYFSDQIIFVFAVLIIVKQN